MEDTIGLHLTGLAFVQDVVVSVDTSEVTDPASVQGGTSPPRCSTVMGPQAEHGKREQGTATFGMEPSISGQAVMRKVDWHVLPFLCGLSLMCSLDRGEALPPTVTLLLQ